LGLKSTEVLVFEDSLNGAEASRLANLDTAIIWDETHGKNEYKSNIRIFLPDFSPLPGYLDLTYKEWLDHHIELRKEREKKYSETKASDIGKDL
jgi:beta-phosphoglucomutase-like phosphatase (HAD superfamily)